MTDHAELIERLREADPWDIPSLAESLMEDAADRIAALVAERDALKADHDEAREILAEFKAEIAKLAENDPEFNALQAKRFSHSMYSGSWERGALKASANNYRAAAMLALTENISLKMERDELRAALAQGGEKP